MQQYVVYAVSLVLMSTTHGEVSQLSHWVSGIQANKTPMQII